MWQWRSLQRRRQLVKRKKKKRKNPYLGLKENNAEEVDKAWGKYLFEVIWNHHGFNLNRAIIYASWHRTACQNLCVINENFWLTAATDLSPGSLEKRVLVGFNQNCSEAGANNVRPQVNECFWESNYVWFEFLLWSCRYSSASSLTSPSLTCAVLRLEFNHLRCFLVELICVFTTMHRHHP